MTPPPTYKKKSVFVFVWQICSRLCICSIGIVGFTAGVVWWSVDVSRMVRVSLFDVGDGIGIFSGEIAVLDLNDGVSCLGIFSERFSLEWVGFHAWHLYDRTDLSRL